MRAGGRVDKGNIGWVWGGKGKSFLAKNFHEFANHKKHRMMRKELIGGEAVRGGKRRRRKRFSSCRYLVERGGGENAFQRKKGCTATEKKTIGGGTIRAKFGKGFQVG